MLPKSSPSLRASPDAELEWLLCLAAALQARQKQPANSAAEYQSPPASMIRRKLRALLKRSTPRIPAA
jgi:hypothetical protein